MRVVSLIVALAGIVVFVMAFLTAFTSVELMGIRPQGFLRGTVSLFLLAITIMVYDKTYPRKPAPPKRKRK